MLPLLKTFDLAMASLECGGHEAASYLMVKKSNSANKRACVVASARSQPIGGQKNDAGAPHMLLGRVAV